MISRNTSLVKFLKGCRQLLYMIARPEKSKLETKMDVVLTEWIV